MNKFIILILLLNFLNLINCQFSVLEITDVGGIDGNVDIYNRYPIASHINYCRFEFNIMILDNDNLADQISVQNYDFINFDKVIYNSSAVIYRVKLENQPFGTYNLPINITRSNIFQTFFISYTCHEINLSSVSFELLTNFKHNNPYVPYNSVLKLKGLNDTLKILSSSIISVNYGYNTFILYIPTYNNPVTSDLNLQITFPSGVLQINVPSMYTYNYNENVEIIKYPNQVEIFKVPGFGYSPLYKITSNYSSASVPFYNIKTPSQKTIQPYKLVYGKPGNYIYIGNFDLVDNGNNYIIQTQVGDDFINVGNVNFTIQNINVPPLTISLSPNNQPNGMYTVELLSSGIYGFIYYSYSFLYNSRLSLPFPFGFASGNHQQYKLKVSIPKPVSYYMDNSYFSFSSFDGSLSESLLINLDIDSNNNPPKLLSYEIHHLYDFYYLIKIQTDANLLSNRTLSSIKIGLDYYGYETCVSSCDNNPTFEIIIDSTYQFYGIKLEDIKGRQTDYPFFYDSINSNFRSNYYKMNPLSMVYAPQSLMDFDLFSIRNISYLKNNLDVRNGIVSNIIYFDFSNHYEIDYTFSFVISDRTTMRSLNKFFSKWNPIKKLFQVEFFIDQNTLTGPLSWLLLSGNSHVYFFSSVLPSDQQLIIRNSNFDVYGPIFTQFKPYFITTPNMNIVYYNVTIEDMMNGFDHGYIEIKGEIDGSIYSNTFNISNIESGDIYNGNYRIGINIKYQTSFCLNQNYTITKVQLYDTQNNLNEYSKTRSSQSEEPITALNPFIQLLDKPEILRIDVTCFTNILDLTPPTLVSFNYILSLNGSVTFTFIAEDLETGLKYDQNPIVYVTSNSLKTVQCLSKIINYNLKNATYECSLTISNGLLSYGESNLYLSVYGFINNGGSYSGYSTEDLFFNGFHFTILKSVLITNQMVIERTSTITSTDNKLWIIGKEFKSGQIVEIVYSDGSPTLQFTPNKLFETVLLVENLKPTNKSFTVRVFSSSTDMTSNTVTVIPMVFDYSDIVIPSDTPSVTPTPTDTPSSTPSETPSSTPSSTPTETPSEPTSQTPLPTNAPQKCIGKPECGGPSHGYCSNGVSCICYSPWLGLDCLSRSIIIPQPDPVIDNPTIEIPIFNNQTNNGGGNPDKNEILYKSIVSLVSLRELDYEGNQVNIYSFDKWIYNEINSTTNQYFTSINVPSVNGGRETTTNLTVTLQWFKDETTVYFADEVLLMNPSSVKYTIEITSYRFKQVLNSLQLVMSALFESNQKNNNICSAQEFGETSNGDNSNYIKISIDDHSLYGRFIKRAIIDSKIKSVSNKLLDSTLNEITSTYQSQQTFIGITIPWYRSNIIIDPDFSVLLDSNKVTSDSLNSICKKSSKLTGAQLAGIIIGSIAFASVITVSIIYYFYKKKKDLKLLNKLHNKLKPMNK